MKQGNYEDENGQLYELHLERMRRKNMKLQEQALSKQIKKQQKQQESPDYSHQIYLNSVIYDERDHSKKYNSITFAQLLHQNPKIFPKKPLSSGIQSILITTYGYESQVFQPILKSKVPFIIVNRQGNQLNGFIKKNHNGFNNWTLLSPPKSNMGYGVFHTKLWLIKFNTFLRVVVCTSNHHFNDWTVWQNAFWYHDCPIKTKSQTPFVTKLEEKDLKHIIKQFDFQKDFIQTLKWVLKELQPPGFNILEEMKINLENYSFENIDAILIPSFPGRFKGSLLDKVGIGKVKKIMEKCCKYHKNPVLTYNSTSLGKPDEKLVRELYFAFNPKIINFTPNRFKLVYPTQQYVTKETCGQAQVLFLTKQNYQKCELRNHIFHKYQKSESNGVTGGIPHLKTIVIQEQSQQLNKQQTDRCILYVGSHNFTRAAWGSYQKGDTQLYCSNSELGLLFLNYKSKQLINWLPYRLPPTKYSTSDQPYFKL